jgi:sugar transferase (PEP-CTERM system associated)
MFAPRALASRALLLIVGDFLVATLAAHVSFALVSYTGPAVAAEHDVVLLAPLFGLLYVIAINFEDLYAVEQPASKGRIITALFTAAVKLSAILAIVMLSNDRLLLGRRVYVTYIVSATLLLILWRVAVNASANRRVRHGVMILGNSEFARLIAHEIGYRTHLGYKFLGFVHGGRRARAVGESASLEGEPAYLTSSLDMLFAEGQASSLVVEANEALQCPPQELMRWRLRGVEIIDCESFYERITGKLPVTELRETWLVFAPGFMRQRWRMVLKRAIDVATSTLVMLITLPVAIVAAIAIKLDSKGPLFYAQERIGLQGQIFRILKFRSMKEDAEKRTGATWATPGDPRVTRVGRIIRRLRIDELPQLINVLKGDMSLVGPRPERPQMVSDLKRVLSLYDYRHSVRPGLTGWAQVCYRYGANIDDAREKLCYDLYYIKNWSLTFDLQIMLQTIKVVLYGRGAR